jgi:histidine ammonia-lyase
LNLTFFFLIFWFRKYFFKVHGITHDTLKFVRKVLTEELNSATDNPLVFLKDDHASFEKDCMLSGGNFHGEYSSKVLDFLTIAISEIGSISERRIERLVNP